MNAIVKAAALAGTLLAWGVASAAPVDVYLQTEAYTKDLVNSEAVVLESVPMWRYVCDAAAAAAATADNAACDGSGSGSARISVAAGDDLTIHLANTLGVDTSIIVPGQAEDGAGAPTFFVDGKGRNRVKSFTHEAGATSGTDSYTFTAIRPGTYLYQSGSYPSIQVPMGLYGALIVGPATGVVCTAGQPAYNDLKSCYDDEVVLLFSEVDPWQNAAVAAAAGVGDYPSTVDYNPTYLLINGELSANLAGIGDAGTPTASNVLLRMLNAGNRSHTPAIVGLDMSLVAEDGNSYPGNALVQSEALLPAGKTLDAIVAVTDAVAAYSLYDRTPDFTNNALPQGGMVANVLANGATPVAPGSSLATDDVYNGIPEDCGDPVSCVAGATSWASTSSVLANDPGLGNAMVVSTTKNGTLVLGTDGNFTYAPNENFSGVDGFTYSADDGGGNVYGATVTLNVTFVNDAPVAVADGTYGNTVGTDVVVDAAHGVLGNDTDVDGDYLTAEVDITSTGCADLGTDLVLAADGSFTYSGMAGATFCYQAVDEDGLHSAPATVDLTYMAPSNIALTVVDPTGYVLDDYRWLVQEDVSYWIDPANPDSVPPNEQLSLNFHKSSYPVVASGCSNCTDEIPFSQLALDPTKHYYVSILPNDAGLGLRRQAGDTTFSGHTIGGAQIAPGQTAVTVLVHKQDIPLAQVSVLAFEDSEPTNGVPDANEQGLGGFTVIIEDSGGRYGMSGGPMLQDAFGNPLENSLIGQPGCDVSAPPPSVILTCPDGTALIKNLPPGKFGVIVVPPAAEVDQWTQTETIEGTKVIDTWVKAGEPPFMVEFGAPGPHAWVGFVNPSHTCIGAAPCQVPTPPPPAPACCSAVTGHVTLQHDPRPPAPPGSVDTGNYNGLSHTRAWIGLNTIAGDGPNIATVQADESGTFTINGIPDGTYQLVVWDTYLDQVISFQTVTLPTDAGDIGNIAVPEWFTRTEHNVFLDDGAGGGIAGNGVRDGGEVGLPDQAVNIRWRDGTMNQSFPTDTTGYVPLDEMFPFFAWQIMEVDYTRFRPTGVTVLVDKGGPVTDPTADGPESYTAPQIQTADCTPGSGCTRRTEQGSTVLLEGIQGFPGQTSLFDWGKIPYQPGQNGGIAGIVFYSSTRGEENPRLTAGDPWEPGIANVPVRLYREIARDPAEVDIDVDLTDGTFPQPGDTDWNGNGIWDGPTTLTLVAEVTTDSWDGNPPTGCQGEDPADPFTIQTLGLANIDRCYDGWRNWNQVRPGVFDGGFAFNDIPAGTYVVEVVVPPGYEIYKEQDMNVGLGDSFGPDHSFASTSVVMPNGMLVTVAPDQAMIAEASQGLQPGIAQPACVGPYHEVPAELSLFPGEAAPYAGAWRPLCTRKRVVLQDQGQAASDFHLLTQTPIATQYYGLLTDDISNETNPASPGFGEKFSPAYVPVAIRDFTGHEVYRGHSDAYGHYNGLAPSTFTANIPIPSGYSPAMMAACLNDPGDNNDDPLIKANYGRTCYTAQFMPGTTTYLDTPMLPTAAFAAGFNPADCAAPAKTPTISSVIGPGGVGPYVAAAGGTLTINSHGMTTIPNPAYEGPGTGTVENITRDLGFGSSGTVRLNNTVLGTTAWSDTQISATVPGGLPNGTYQLSVTRTDGSTSVNAVTVTKGGVAPVTVTPAGGPHAIQDAIDGAANGDLILVGAGTYHEMVIMWKPVKLQGVGTDTNIIAVKLPPENLVLWLDKVANLFGDGVSGAVDPLPNQGAPFDLNTEQGAGITVLSKNDGNWTVGRSRIDGFTITGADLGGGIYVNGWADNLVISNNNITGNSGFSHGGIRIGQPFLAADGTGPFAFNTNVRIHHNSITSNGATNFESAGGGIALDRGTDNYTVNDNFICGNFTAGDGAGIGHLGRSDNGTIRNNTIVFNQSLNNEFTQSGGGIFVGGEPGEAPALTLGTGNVTIDSNVIKGNHAASGHGGGIRTQLVNGADVEASNNTNNWFRVTITNNMVVNNVAGWSGAGISLQDTVNASIVLNTIANNDSTATVGGVLDASGVSTRKPAGISSELNSLGLNGAIPGGSANKAYSNPVLTHNIIWHNRAFHFDGAALAPALTVTTTGQCPAGADYFDVGVLDTAPSSVLSPQRNLMTVASGSGNNANIAGDPQFLSQYCNGSRVLGTPGPMLATAAFAEGGNFIDVRYGPLTQAWSVADGTNATPWNYHIGTSSPAIDFGNNTGGNSPGGSTANLPTRTHDIDNQPRPVDYPGLSYGNNRHFDLGADEVQP